jgi:hypothetical protein
MKENWHSQKNPAKIRINRSIESQDGPAPLAATSTRRRVVSGRIHSGLILKELIAED